MRDQTLLAAHRRKAFSKSLRKKQSARGRRGQTLAMFAVMFAVLVAFMGLVLDGGRIYFDKRRMQVAADGGALAAAQEMWRGHTNVSTQVRPAALNVTAHNGYDDSNATIAVNVPPTSGPNAGDSDFVEVIITKASPMTFMRVLGLTQAPVAARAVAGLVQYADMCILAMNRNVQGAITTNGTPVAQADCGVMSNSADGCGLEAVGASIVNASWIGVSGGHCGGGTLVPTPEHQVPPMQDPLWYLPDPDYSGWPNATYDSATNTYQCPTGQCVFNSEVKITNGTESFEPGFYVTRRGMHITGGDVSGTGLTFYNPGEFSNAFFDIGGNARVRFDAPTSGTWKGVLFHTSSSAPDSNPGNRIQRGTSDSYFQGAVHIPSQDVSWAGNPSALNKWAMVIADEVQFQGTSDVQVFKLPDDVNELPKITKATLVE